MTEISKLIHETERRAQALLADLVPLVSEEDVSRDPEFILLLERAIDQAELHLASAKAEAKYAFSNNRPKESPAITEKPGETPAA